MYASESLRIPTASSNMVGKTVRLTEIYMKLKRFGPQLMGN
jgi:hypothetical protein